MEINETVAVVSAADDKDKCPFCNEDRHDFPKKKKNQQTKVASKPKQLNCSDVPGGATGKWTTAAHHLICAKQCYAMLTPLVRMGSMCGYDINSPSNGHGLPTFKNKYDGSIWGESGDAGKKAKYGDLDETQKQRVANWAMDQTKAQWHVGHHKFEQQIDWDVEEFGDDEEMDHAPSYDAAVLTDLYKLFQLYTQDPFPCKEEEDEGTNIKADMDKISEKIKTALKLFKAGTPWKSRPYFVSQRAVKYASDKKAGK